MPKPIEHKSVQSKLSQNQFTLYNSAIFSLNWAIIDYNLMLLAYTG